MLSNVTAAATSLDIRPQSSYIPGHLAHRGRLFRKGMPEKAERGAVPARGYAIRSRAALGPRSTGKRTGPHEACLTEG
jgi:hypothetical protein